MNPALQRILMILAGVVCLVAAHFLPTNAAVLLPAGVGLLGWAAPAPGHGGPTVPPAALALLFAGTVAAGSQVACSALKQVPEGDRAALVRIAFAEARSQCSAYQASGGKHDPEADQLCLALLLGDRATTTVEAPPPSDGGGGR